MDAVLAALEQSWLATHLRTARWEYAALNATHIFGIALTVGAIVPLNLKLLGLWPNIERQTLARVLVPVAASGLVLAMATGLLLFSVRAKEYLALPVLWLKLGLVGFGVATAVAAHWRYGLWLTRHPQKSLAHVGALSIATWIAVLVSGRLIAFFN